MKVSSVSIFEDKKLKRIHGITYYEYPNDFEKIQDKELLGMMVRADVGMSYAGLIAEKNLFKSISGSSQTPMFISDGSADDNKAARDIIKKYDLAPAGKKRANYKSKLMREVRRELLRHWDAVVLIAHALFQHRKLTYVDVCEILVKKSDNKFFWRKHLKTLDKIYACEPIDEQELKVALIK